MTEAFNPKHQYGDFIEIVPEGAFSVFRGRSFSGDWNDKNIKLVTDELTADWMELIPKQYHHSVKTIIQPPIDDSDPLHRTGTIAWKSIPQKTIED